jgi:hypothetical protein
MDPRRIEGWGWTALVAAGTALVLGLSIALGSSGPAGAFTFPAAVILIGIASGLVARRAADLLGVVAAVVLVFELLAVREIAEHEAPLQTLNGMFGIALIPGGFAALLGLIVLGVRRAVRRAGIKSVLLQGAAIVLVLGGLGTLYVIAAGRATRIDTFRVTGERDITVTVVGGSASWCRVTSVGETTADVTIDAACVSLILGPTTAAGILMDLPVHLAQPIGDRIVRNLDGSVVRQVPPPVHAVGVDRATEIAQDVLRAAHPGIALENSKILDLVLERHPSGRPAYRVNIIVVDGPFASSSPTSIWLWIDAESGAVEVISSS